MPKRRVLVTAALPYANAELHIGHARSTYIPADIYVRYRRLKGDEAYYVCGTDEHGTPISVMAEKLKVKPLEITEKIYEQDIADFKKLNISFDNFSRTTRAIHYETTQWFFKELYGKGLIYEKEVELPYCNKCGRFLPDRYVYGTCPYCGFEDARGDECDVCGRALSIGELINPKCVVCKSPAVNKTSKHWFLKLSSFQDWLAEWIRTEGLLPVTGKSYLINQYLQPGLEDVCISRDLDWGVPIPLPEAEGKVCYVWFDAPIGYIDSTKELFQKLGNPEGWREFWLNDETELIHFIGKGILYHHTLFWPAMLKGVGYRVPTVIAAFAYGNLEGRKMSKSRGWYLSLKDFLDVFEADALRYYWIAASPLTEDADFVFDDFSNKYNSELADTLGNFIHRVLVFCAKNYNSIIPSVSDRDELEKIEKIIEETLIKVEKSIEGFEFREGLLSIVSLARIGNKIFNDGEPWHNIKNNPLKAATTIGLCLRLIQAIAVLINPYLPQTSLKILEMLNLNLENLRWSDIAKPLPVNHKISTPTPLFRKLEEAQISRLKNTVYARLQSIKETSLEQVDVKDVSKLDLKVGEIIKAEPIEGDRGCFRLEVKISDKETFILREKFTCNLNSESLEGLKIILKPNIVNKDKKAFSILKVKCKDGYKPVKLDRDISIGAGVS
ncbi:MAG: methionine--tRNA ligase [Candidatus Odinarchaeum yellowstonii]|uniref:Methionine--tRNA ligase n=1 Tax=Odinarchaeota yellowstonii (strain LCB_4) TaxID=1841599 RepID=A0AAF0IBU5_ODILC|nr:MAG: methionine--tRNA ligase [Candidatus Odinarchaeum yellowstonii]